MHLGLVVHLGHGGKPCPNSFPSEKNLVVIDLTGIQDVRVSWCNCTLFTHDVPRRTQLLRLGWYPATFERPNTVITFNALSFFHSLSLHAKTNFYDFYETLKTRIDNSGFHRVPVRTSLFVDVLLIGDTGLISGSNALLSRMEVPQDVEAA